MPGGRRWGCCRTILPGGALREGRRLRQCRRLRQYRALCGVLQGLRPCYRGHTRCDEQASPRCADDRPRLSPRLDVHKGTVLKVPEGVGQGLPPGITGFRKPETAARVTRSGQTDARGGRSSRSRIADRQSRVNSGKGRWPGAIGCTAIDPTISAGEKRLLSTTRWVREASDPSRCRSSEDSW